MLNDQKRELSNKLTEKFREFLTQHSPSVVSRHLRRLLLEYLICKQKIGMPVNFNTQLWELSDLFDLLDVAADEWEYQKEDEDYL